MIHQQLNHQKEIITSASRNKLNYHPRTGGDLEKPCKYLIPAFAGITENGKNAISRCAIMQTGCLKQSLSL